MSRYESDEINYISNAYIDIRIKVYMIYLRMKRLKNNKQSNYTCDLTKGDSDGEVPYLLSNRNIL